MIVSHEPIFGVIVISNFMVFREVLLIFCVKRNDINNSLGEENICRVTISTAFFIKNKRIIFNTR